MGSVADVRGPPQPSRRCKTQETEFQPSVTPTAPWRDRPKKDAYRDGISSKAKNHAPKPSQTLPAKALIYGLFPESLTEKAMSLHNSATCIMIVSFSSFRSMLQQFQQPWFSRPCPFRTVSVWPGDCNP
jgi:hypothetical protein